jgi:hypothetical protein
MAGKLGAHIRGNVVAYIALFIALGGTSYAAINLPRNSVGSKQLRSNGTIETITDSPTAGGLPTVGGTSRQGTGIVVVSAGTGTFGARGSWAVTAP